MKGKDFQQLSINPEEILHNAFVFPTSIQNICKDNNEANANLLLQQAELKIKNKRRYKNDNKGRSFNCGCGKSYLSYPALYTHIKNKHHGMNPSGLNPVFISSTKNRGRPKKLVYGQTKIEAAKENNNQSQVNCENSDAQDNYVLNNDEIIKSFDVFDTSGCNILECFQELSKSQNIKEFQFILKMNEIISKMKDNRNSPLIKNEEVNDSQNSISGDIIICKYLIEMSSKVKSTFMKILILFVCIYRDCLEEHGWEIIQSYRIVSEKEKEKKFLTVNGGRYFPRASNYFLKNYLNKKLSAFEPSLAIQLVMHFCSWLYTNKYTGCRLSLI